MMRNKLKLPEGGLRPLMPIWTLRKTQAGHKRLFCGLMCLTAALLSGILAAFYSVARPGLTLISPWLDQAVFILLCAAGFIFLVLPCLQLIIQIYTGKTLPFTQKLRGLTQKFFLPLMELLGQVFRIPRDRVRHAFVHTNNTLLHAEKKTYTPENILVLIPHCLQKHHCAQRLTHNLGNCLDCGACSVAGLKRLAGTYGVHVAIVTGGSLARRLVLERRPQCIVAVACERDLTSGIQDVAPMPALGIFNTRPFGPCIDTEVAVAEVEAALRVLLGLPPLDEEHPPHAP